MTQPARAYTEHGIRRYAVEGLTPHPISVTTLLKVIAPGEGLVRWQEKRAINAALETYLQTENLDLALTAGQRARWIGSEEADFGSSIHSLTEQADLVKLGKQTQIEPVADMKKATPYLRQWEKMRDEFSMNILAVEVTLVNTTKGYAGTADRIVEVPTISTQPIVLDLKSGRGVYPDAAMQCAGLSRCDKILYDDGTLADIPWKLDQARGAVAHVRPRSSHLIPLDLDAAWPVFGSLPLLALWRAETIKVLGEPVEPDEVLALRAGLRLRFKQLPDDLRTSVLRIVGEDPDLAGGNTHSWNDNSLRRATEILAPYEQQARDRIHLVLRSWGTRGEQELLLRILDFTNGRTSLATELSGEEVDRLIASL